MGGIAHTSLDCCLGLFLVSDAHFRLVPGRGMCHSKSMPLSTRLAKNPLALLTPIPSSETRERRAFLAMRPSLGTRGIRSSACLPALPACLPSASRASRCGAFGESGGGFCSVDSPARGSFAAWGAGKLLANQAGAWFSLDRSGGSYSRWYSYVSALAFYGVLTTLGGAQCRLREAQARRLGWLL